MKSYLIDTHIHTDEVSPCGKIKATEMVELYREAGYDGIIITDHYFQNLEALGKTHSWKDKIARYLAGYHNAVDRGKEIGIDVFWGLELTFNGPVVNDFLVYGLDESFLIDNPKLSSLDLHSFWQMTKDLDILIIQAHPFRPYGEAAPHEYLDGVEVYNGNPRQDSRNHLALQYAEKHHLIQSSGSDAHLYEDIARGGLLFPERVETMKDIINLLRAGEARIVSPESLVESR